MDSDFLIVGGGIAGLSAGAALARLGRVTLWDAEDALGRHASGRSAAMFEENYGPAPVAALSRASRDDHRAAGHLTPRGFLAVAVGDDQAAGFDADLDELGLEEIAVDDARGKVPILSEAVRRAGWHGAASDLDTDAMMQSCARAIRAAGGRIEMGRRVDALTRVPWGWRVGAGEVTATARVVVNAAGPWADEIARLAGIAPLDLRPLRRSMARLAAPGGHDVRGWPMVMGAGEGWYAKPDAGAWIVSPADEDPSEAVDAVPCDMVLAEGLDRYQGAVDVEVTRPLATWAGLRTFTPDGTPALGASEDADFIWCAGQGGYGMQTAPAAGRLVADLVAGRPPELGPDMVAALDPGRFQ